MCCVVLDGNGRLPKGAHGADVCCQVVLLAFSALSTVVSHGRQRVNQPDNPCPLSPSSSADDVLQHHNQESVCVDHIPLHSRSEYVEVQIPVMQP